MQKKELCYFGASRWTRVIGWFHLIIWSFCYLALSIAIIFPAHVLESDNDRDRYAGWRSFFICENKNESLALETTPPPQLESTMSILGLTVDPIISIVVVFFISCLLGFGMSIILLRGSHTKNTLCLELWLIYSGVYYFGLPTLVLAKFAKVNVINGAILFINCLIQGFSWFAVHTHKREIVVAASKSNNYKVSTPSDAKL